MRQSAVATALLLGLAACATAPEPPPPPTTRTLATAPGTAKARLVERLVELGFSVSGTNTVEARNAAADPAWASCANVRVRDPSTDFSRADRAEPESRTATISAATRAAESGTTVIVNATYAATYRNIFINLPFTRPCRSTGVLEAELLRAAG